MTHPTIYADEYWHPCFVRRYAVLFIANSTLKVSFLLPFSHTQWSVGTILMGLYSFMLEEAPTYGSIVTSAQYKRQAASESLEFNHKNK